MTSNHYASTCVCHTCDREFHPLGIARHRAMHRDKSERCKISYTDGTTYVFKFDNKPAQPTGEK